MVKKLIVVVLACCSILITNLCCSAQDIPQIINYQGQVEVSGQPFSGSGEFRFALTNESGTTPYWSNDNNYHPLTGVTITVENGLFNVALGDTSIADMEAIPASVFDNESLYLHVWFNDGTTGLQKLDPAQPLMTSSYSFEAFHALDSDAVDGNPYDSTWVTSLDNIKTACPDFHFLGGIDDDQPDTDSEVPDRISISNNLLFAPANGDGVGIGTTSPDEKLEVNGNIVIDDSLIAASTSGLKFVDHMGNSTMYIDLLGRVCVGSGSESLTQRFQVSGSMIATGNVRTTGIRAYDAEGIEFLGSYGTNFMKMATNGYFGINTSNPQSRLHVNGSIIVDDTIKAEDSSGLYLATDEGTNRFYLADTGNISIGSSDPESHRLTVDSDGTGVSGSTVNITNTSATGIAFSATANSEDCTMLLVQSGDGNIITADTYYGGWDRVFVLETDGQMGVQRNNAVYTIHTGGGAFCNGSSWVNSTKEMDKSNSTDLTIEEAKTALNKLNPQRMTTKDNPDDEILGFFEEELPELVATKSHDGVSPVDLIAVLTKVIQDQQKQLEKQKQDINKLKIAMNKLAEK